VPGRARAFVRRWNAGVHAWHTGLAAQPIVDRISNMRLLAFLCLLATCAPAQTGNLGLFTNSDDIGAPPMKGAAEFDAAVVNIKLPAPVLTSGQADQFHYVWREMSGDFAVTATAKFLTDGIDHRKATIMLRQTTDADSPFVHFVIHGNGMPSVQFRTVKGGSANTIDMPILGAGTFKLKLVRQGSAITVWLAKGDEPLRQLGTTQNQMGVPFSSASRSHPTRRRRSTRCCFQTYPLNH